MFAVFCYGLFYFVVVLFQCTIMATRCMMAWTCRIATQVLWILDTLLILIDQAGCQSNAKVLTSSAHLQHLVSLLFYKLTCFNFISCNVLYAASSICESRDYLKHRFNYRKSMYFVTNNLENSLDIHFVRSKHSLQLCASSLIS